MAARATMRDVARRAGVSLQSVSNALNGRTSQLREETRQRILQSIRELGYQPDARARAMRSQCTNTVGFLTIDPATRFLADPFHVAVLSGIVDRLRQQHYSLFVQGLEPEEAGEAFRKLVHQRRFDGAVVHLSGLQEQRERHIKELEESGCPFVLIEERVSAPTAAAVLADNRNGGGSAVAYLRAHGHEQIGFLATDRSWPAVDLRIAGYQEALRTTGGGRSRVWCVEHESIESACEATEKGLREDPSVTALLCATDLLAVGALKAARRLRRAVPSAFAVVGFDDFEFAQLVDPALTTVSVPAYEMGSRAADLLLEYYKNGNFSTPEVVFPTTLVRRGSA
jgi:DNA-binding LacI/PurR family transcriptional regulator